MGLWLDLVLVLWQGCRFFWFRWGFVVAGSLGWVQPVSGSGDLAGTAWRTEVWECRLVCRHDESWVSAPIEYCIEIWSVVLTG